MNRREKIASGYQPKPNGNMHAKADWIAVHRIPVLGITAIPETERTPLLNKHPMDGVCTTCLEMYGSGVRTAGVITPTGLLQTQSLRQVHLVPFES